jgi:hypothetical protein
LVFDVLRVDGNAGHGADLHALRFVKMTDALGAFGRVDFVNFFAQINRFVGALRFTHIAVDAFVGDHQCHGWGSAKFCKGVMAELSATGLNLNNGKAVGSPGRGSQDPTSRS